MTDTDTMVQVVISVQRDGLTVVRQFYDPEVDARLVGLLLRGALSCAMQSIPQHHSEVPPHD